MQTKITKLLITISLLAPTLSIADFNLKDLNELITKPFSIDQNLNKSIKSIRNFQKYHNKNFSFTSRISSYHNDESYSILWFKTNNNIHVGCLANNDSNVFDDFKIKELVTVKGKIHHIDADRRQVVLKRGCTITKAN